MAGGASSTVTRGVIPPVMKLPAEAMVACDLKRETLTAMQVAIVLLPIALVTRSWAIVAAAISLGSLGVLLAP
jgi:hypothetical protein